MFVPSLKVKITNLLRLSIEEWYHHGDVIMSAMASQITSVPIVYLTVCSGTDQRKHQSSASLAFVRGIHWWPVNSPHKGPVTRKIFPFDGVIVKIQIHIFISSKQFSKERANGIFSLWCGLSVSTHSKATPQGRQAEPWWRASIWRSHRKVVMKQCSYHNNIIDIQNRLPYSKVVYPAIIVLFSCLMEVNNGVRTGPDYPFR